MAMASPTPMGASHFASLSRRPSSRQAYRQIPSRPQLHRSDSVPVENHARTYSLNDSSDDEIAPPMSSALTNALLNAATPSVDGSPITKARISPERNANGIFHGRAASVNTVPDRISPNSTRVYSPYPRRIVRLSGTPGSSTLRRTSSLSSAVRKHNEIAPAKAESPLDLSTPAPVPRTVRTTTTSSGNHGISAGSSGRLSSRTDSASRGEEVAPGSQENPTTAARSNLATSQGSVSRYGTVGRTRYGEEAGLQSSMRVKRVVKVAGQFMKGPARRGRRRMEDEDQSPVDEQGDSLDAAGSSQEPQNPGSQISEPQNQDSGSGQKSDAKAGSFFASSYKDFASGSPIRSKDIIDSVLRSKSPPPPTLASSQKSSESNGRAAPQLVQPVFKVPAPRPDLPSAHDQGNDAPPTFKRNKQTPLILMDKIEKVPVRPESMILDVLRAATPSDRRPLAPRSQNTPRRPAPPPPKMSILDAATSTAGAATASNTGGKKNRLRVNGKHFTRLDCIGRGGSSRVYRVMAENSRFFALKRVSLDDADEAAVRGFKGEIDLLKKLEGEERVIQLYDYELNEEKGTLSVVSILLPSFGRR
jgi:serine/threonine-protein kinase TTK/MPS1